MVLTGGPGSGKTTLVTLLAEVGFATAPEAGRGIIRDQVTIGGRGLPWVDPELFGELMLAWELRSYHWARARSGPVFFDQGLPGLPAWWRLIGRTVPGYVTAAVTAHPFRGPVFVAPPWPEIYSTDAERKQDLAEAVRTYEVVVDTYTAHGYELVELPRVGPAERLAFVLDRTGLS